MKFIACLASAFAAFVLALPIGGQTAPSLDRQWRLAASAFCRKSTGAACSAFTTDALQCFAVASGANDVYQFVLWRRKTGLTNGQVQAVADQFYGNDSANAAIAAAALEMMNQHRKYSAYRFESVILQVCLANAAR